MKNKKKEPLKKNIFNPNEEIPNSKNPVRDILSIDFMERKLCKWKLVPFEEIQKFKDKLWIKTGCTYFSDSVFGDGYKLRSINEILWFFPGVEHLLAVNYGKMAIAGGVFTSDFYGNSDVDIFFHSCSKDEANEMLKNSISYLVENHEELTGGILYLDDILEIDKNKTDVQIERKLHVTNVKILITVKDKNSNYSWVMTKTYQFIQRIYPSLDSIIGGFDLGPSMITYDGKNVWTTRLGAWSLANKTIILDLSRRSTTFSSRLQKYSHRGFRIIIPGINKSVEKKFLTKRGQYSSFGERVNILKLQARELGLVFTFDQNSKSDYNGEVIDYSINTFIKMESDAYQFPDFYIGILENLRDYGHCNMLNFKRFDTKNIEDLKQASDYEGWKFPLGVNLIRINSSAIVCDNLEGVTIFLSPENLKGKSREEVEFLYDNLVKNPKVSTLPIKYDPEKPYQQYGYLKYGKYTKSIRKFSEEQKEKVLKELNLKLKAGKEEAREKLIGNTWITENPQRQWTSSINPEVIDVVKYYNNHHNGCWIGIDKDVETTLRLGIKFDPKCWIYGLPKVLLTMILAYVIEMSCDEWKNIEPENPDSVTRKNLTYGDLESVMFADDY